MRALFDPLGAHYVPITGGAIRQDGDVPTVPMTRERLLAFFESERVDPASYTLDGGHPSECYVVDDRRSEWVVYYSERGLETGLRAFPDEGQALEHLVALVVRDPTTRLRP
jgi:hypothetical protein